MTVKLGAFEASVTSKEKVTTTWLRYEK